MKGSEGLLFFLDKDYHLGFQKVGVAIDLTVTIESKATTLPFGELFPKRKAALHAAFLLKKSVNDQRTIGQYIEIY